MIPLELYNLQMMWSYFVQEEGINSTFAIMLESEIEYYI